MSEDSDKFAEQAKFFDYIYPSISRKLDDLERKLSMHPYQISDLKSQINIQNLTIDQYKKKIQRIEQMLIKLGLLGLLKNNKDDEL